jgi:hypothetical protein
MEIGNAPTLGDGTPGTPNVPLHPGETQSPIPSHRPPIAHAVPAAVGLLIGTPFSQTSSVLVAPAASTRQAPSELTLPCFDEQLDQAALAAVRAGESNMKERYA